MAFEQNVELEYERNGERYEFLRWGQAAFDNFRVVPPGTGICHQVNLEYLAQTVWTRKDEDGEIDRLSRHAGRHRLHTTMVNGLAVLGWGVGGIEAEAAMLGQPISMLIPEVVGFRMTGKLAEGITATDLVLTVTQMLRKKGVVGKFVEFYGAGLDHLALEDRATIGNMAPEYGATCGFFPVDGDTLGYLDDDRPRRRPRRAGRGLLPRRRACCATTNAPDPVFTDTLELDLATVVPSLAGPKRPQDRVAARRMPSRASPTSLDQANSSKAGEADKRVAGRRRRLHDRPRRCGDRRDHLLHQHLEPLRADRAPASSRARRVEKGLKPKPWVKTSLAPGSQVVDRLSRRAPACRTISTRSASTSSAMAAPPASAIPARCPRRSPRRSTTNDLVAASVLSGNRNFEGRVNPDVRANYLASPPLVVAYALAGSMQVDLTTEPLGTGTDGKPVYLKDIWPTRPRRSPRSSAPTITPRDVPRRAMPTSSRATSNWQKIEVEGGLTYRWNRQLDLCAEPALFRGHDASSRSRSPTSTMRASSASSSTRSPPTTSRPAGSIKRDEPGRQLSRSSIRCGRRDFNSYGARRGNHEVMMRGTFANIRIKNQMVPGVEGGVTMHEPDGEQMPIYDAAMRYQAEGVPLVIFAGKEYGTGSSRDWAAKGTRLLGVRAVIAQSFERIHRSNLVGMGVLPLRLRGRHDLADARPQGRRDRHDPRRRQDEAPGGRHREGIPRHAGQADLEPRGGPGARLLPSDLDVQDVGRVRREGRAHRPAREVVRPVDQCLGQSKRHPQNGKDRRQLQGWWEEPNDAQLGYTVPNLLIEYVMRNTHVPVGPWRGVNTNQNG